TSSKRDLSSDVCSSDHKKIIEDIIFNIIGLMMPMAVLQFISLPYIASILGAETYGETTFLISVFTLIALPLGNVLNNVRLLENNKYKKENIVVDFNYLLINSIIYSSIIFFIVSTQIGFISFKNIIFLLVIILLTIIKEYYVVSFRLELNFKKIMLHNLFLSMGYLLGTYLFKLTGNWEYIYI